MTMVRTYSNILNLLNISMMLNKSIIQCSLVGVTTSSLQQPICYLASIFYILDAAILHVFM